jgi:predicted nucleic acid-binding protein
MGSSRGAPGRDHEQRVGASRGAWPQATRNTSTPGVIVLDASFAVKLVVEEPQSDEARAVSGAKGLTPGTPSLCPPSFWPETFSSLRRAVHRRIPQEEDGVAAVSQLRSMPIQTQEPEQLYERAWALAVRFNRPTIYDCCYLALAEISGCVCWTADQRLANALGSGFPLLRTI